jgi:hypothetical protein
MSVAAFNTFPYFSGSARFLTVAPPFPIPLSAVFPFEGPTDPLCRYWIPRKDFTSHASFADDKPISGIQSSTAKLTAGNKTVDTLLVPESFNHELAGLVKIDFKALDQWLEEMRCVVSGHSRFTISISLWNTLTDV